MRLIGSFGVYRAPLNSLWSARACFGDCIALLLSLFWEPSWPLWNTLGSLGAHFGTPGSPLRHLRGVSGQHWRFCVHRRPLRKPRALKYRACAQKLTRWNLHPDEPRFVGNGPRTTIQDIPSTRAGDQDDMSFTNSLKLHTPLYSDEMLLHWTRCNALRDARYVVNRDT